MSYAISAGHIKTAEAADLIFREGGNAADAAIAAFLMSWVAEPCMSSAGGGGFAMVRAAGQKPVLLDFFCQTPGVKRRLADSDFYPVTVDFGDTREVFHVGTGSTGVPGAVDGLFQLHARYGSMPLKELFQPAISAARAGVVVNDFQALDFQLLEPILAVDSQALPVFFPSGKLIQSGERMQMPGLAYYLEHLWREGRRAFYEGEIAAGIAADYQSEGGHLSMDDLKNYTSIWREPLSFNFREQEIFVNPLPSLGGVRIKAFLEYLGDAKVPESMLGQSHLKGLADAFRHIRRMEGIRDSGLHGSTTHFSLADSKGNAVSVTASNGEGCGYFVKGTDIQLNNMLGEAALLPAGFHSWGTDVRLSSMMSPAMMFDAVSRELKMVTGSSGAGRIPYAIAQVLHYFSDFESDIHAAANHPRIHWQEDCWNLEPGFAFNASEVFGEEAYKVWKAQSLYFGGVNSIGFRDGHPLPGTDERREGGGIRGM
ncbi:MAG: gamma-glutamyltranspeptidase [Bacteroidetes bacterium]|nr:gamma-glutamyltranspeptidase [Bacteroidota bacterium]